MKTKRLKQLESVLDRGKMKRKHWRHLQKAVNHTNKLLHRLEQLEEEGVLQGPFSEPRLCIGDVKKHLLWIADERGVIIDPEGRAR